MLEFFERPSVLIVVILIIVVFGAKRLPDSARSLGRSMRILKAEAKGLKDDDGAKVQPAPTADTQSFLPPVHPAHPAHPAQPTAATQAHVVPGSVAPPVPGPVAEPVPHQH